MAVVLDSPGGLISEGLKLGRFFHEAKIATFVFTGGIGCHSACALAFLGGRDATTGKRLRVMMSGARLGFHQFGAKFDPAKTYSKKDMDGVVEEAHRVMDSILGYLRAIGEDISFLPLMLRAPHEAITLVNDDEALMRGIHIMEQKTQRIIDPTNIAKRRSRSAPAETCHDHLDFPHRARPRPFAGLLAAARVAARRGRGLRAGIRQASGRPPAINAIEAKGGIEPGDSVALQAYMAKLPEKSRHRLSQLAGRHVRGGPGARTPVPPHEDQDHGRRQGCRVQQRLHDRFPRRTRRGSGEPWRAKGSTAMLGLDAFKIDWADKEYTAQEMSVAIARTQRMTLAMADYMTEVGRRLEFLRASLKAPAAA